MSQEGQQDEGSERKRGRAVPRRRARRTTLAASAGLLLATSPALAFEPAPGLTIEGVGAAAGQCEALTPGSEAPDECGAGALFQPTVTWQPFTGSQLSVTAGFSAGNALNDRTAFALSPWAADLADDVEDINGRRRDYLLKAWYQHTFALSKTGSLAIAGGLIDSTDFQDTNAFANDELDQFMNEAFVNSLVGVLPSYDYGAAVVGRFGRFTVNAVYMNVGPADATRPFNYVGAELGWRVTSRLGEGNLRVLLNGTDARFLDPEGEREESLFGVSTSIDQRLGEHLGMFVRAGWQRRRAEVDYGAEVTGGLSLDGDAWNREDDTIGLALGHLFAGNADVANTTVAEVFYRVEFSDALALTADLQGMHDDNREGPDVAGLVASLRGTVEF